jgi:hypothetical protein
MFEFTRRTKPLPPPPWVVWESLNDPHRQPTRPWLELLPDETDPQILESVKPTLVVWTSLWPDTPDEVIRFEIGSRRGGTVVTWTLQSPTELDDAVVAQRRYRLNFLLGFKLRDSYDY